MTNYDDIIDLPYPFPSRYPRMSMIDRGAQFSPFAALTGYDAVIQETARLTDSEIQLDEDAIHALNEKILLLTEILPQQPNVTITYFRGDDRKSGGAYRSISSNVLKIDPINRQITLHCGTCISFENIYDIQSDHFRQLEL
jgi:hypothetical protein